MDLPEGVGGGPGTQWAYEHVMDDGTHTDAWCRDPANVVPPRFWMDAHTAPLGIVFYDGGLFPTDARGDAFVAQHGSWNDSPATGYKVVRIRFEGGEPATAEPVAVEPFLESAGPGDTGIDWAHRPVDAKVAADGTLLVTSDASDVVIAVGWSAP
jgi:glucose/arabinose dehydrogenase